jgi:hypothetical protein
MSNTPYGTDHRFDTRVTDYSMRRKEITEAEIRAHLATLPDEASEAVEVNVKFNTPFADRVVRR